MQDIIPPQTLRRRGLVRSTPRERIIERPIPARRIASTGSIDGIITQKAPTTIHQNHSSFDNIYLIESQVVLRVKPSLSRSLAHVAVKTDIVDRAIAAHQRQARSSHTVTAVGRLRRIVSSRVALGVAAVIVLVLTGFLCVDTWQTNNRVKAEFPQVQTRKNTETASEQQAQEGRDETTPAKNSLLNYAVAASLPRAIYINKVNVSARVLPMGVNSDGSVQAPRGIYDAGWYTGSVKPGDIGAMFIDGHASGPTRDGLFAYLDKLVDGDIIEVEKGDNARLRYKVVHAEIQSLDSLDMKKMLLPHGNVSRGLNLMTCTGKWVESKKTFDKRVLIFAEQI